MTLRFLESARTRMAEKTEVQLGVFEKYLVVWIGVCIVLGLFLSQVFPLLSIAINDMQIAGISIPIGICLFLMMYPALLNLRLAELRKLLNLLWENQKNRYVLEVNI